MKNLFLLVCMFVLFSSNTFAQDLETADPTTGLPVLSEPPEDSSFVFFADEKPHIPLDWFKVRIEGDKKIIYLEAGVAGNKDKVERTVPNVPYRLWSRPDKDIVVVVKDDETLKKNFNGEIISGTEVTNFTFTWNPLLKRWLSVR